MVPGSHHTHRPLREHTQPTAHREGQIGSGTDSPAQPRRRSALRRTLCLSPPGPTIRTHTKVGRHLGGPGPTWSSFRGQVAMASSGAIKTGGKQQGGPALVANQTPELPSHAALDGPGLLTPTAWRPGLHPFSQPQPWPHSAPCWEESHGPRRSPCGEGPPACAQRLEPRRWPGCAQPPGEKPGAD